jgi:hypothetical protein
MADESVGTARPGAVLRHVPHYFFHLHDELDVADEEGTELPDSRAAREHAIGEVRAVACESIRKGYLDLSHYVEVTDEQGSTVAIATFSEAIDVSGRKRRIALNRGDTERSS